MAKKKSAAEKGKALYQQAVKNKTVLKQNKGPGRAIATPTGLQKLGKTNAQGLAVGSTRDAPGKPIIPAITDEERANALLGAEYSAGKTAEQKLFGDTTGASTYEEAQKQKALELTQRYTSSKLAQEEQRKALGFSYGQAKSSMENQTAGQVAGLYAGGREGPTSESNVSAANSLKTNLSIRNARLEEERSSAMGQLSQAEADLEAAYRDGRESLIAQARANFANAEMAVSEIETNLLNAQTEASAETRASLTAFQSLVDEGQELSVEAISGFAGQLGIPFEDAYGYYAGVQSIRDDKTLSLEEKELAIADTKYALDQKMKGLSTKEAQSINDYITLVQSGIYTPEQLKAFAVSMNIPDENNPVYMADLAVKQAEAKIKAAEANGELLSPVDQLDYATKLQEYYDLMDITPGTIPNGGSIETTALPDDDGINFQFETGAKISSGKRVLTQCGQFVNDVLGLSMGDSLASKVAFVDENIVLPEPGMGFVISDGIILADGTNTGHTGIVEYYNPETQMVGVADVNARGDNLARHHEIPLAEILQDLNAGKGGFVPGKGLSFDQASQASADTISSTVSVLARATDKKDVVARISDLVTSGNKSELRDYVATIAFEDLPAEAQNRELLRANLVAAGDQLKEYVSQYVDAGGDLGIFAGSSLEIQNKLGDLGDADQQKIGQLIRLMLEDFGRAQTGAAIQDFEKKNFRAILPTLFDGKELIDAKIDAFAEAQQIYTHGTLKKKLGETVYNLVYGEEPEQEPLDEDAMMQEAEEEAKYNSTIDDSDINDINNL